MAVHITCVLCPLFISQSIINHVHEYVTVANAYNIQHVVFSCIMCKIPH